MEVNEMIAESLAHIHTPIGEIKWEMIDDDSRQFSRCKCGVELTRETAPLGARYNWEDWRISNGSTDEVCRL